MCKEQGADEGSPQDRSWGLEEQLDTDRVAGERDLYKITKPCTLKAVCTRY